MRFSIALLCLAVAACGGGGGGCSTKPPSPYQFNAFDQLVSDSTKTEVPCPAQTTQTMVAFVFGQSNSANYASHRAEAASPNIYNYHNGKCYRGSDPLLGSTGSEGSQWVAMANRIIGNHDAIVLIPMGIGGSSVNEWTARLNAPFLAEMNAPFQITHFLWHQGEADALKTTQADYAAGLTSIINQAKTRHPASKFYVSIASVCQNGGDPAIRAAQMGLVDPANGIFQGANTDALLPADRYDDCHFNESGVNKAADMWAAILN